MKKLFPDGFNDNKTIDPQKDDRPQISIHVKSIDLNNSSGERETLQGVKPVTAHTINLNVEF